jgi:peptide alpha-N-acetyltransferase
VLKQFDDILDDQFDFHMYCFRKYTLRQYVELIEFCNTLVNQKTFLTAFTEYIEALLEYEKVKDGFKVEI